MKIMDNTETIPLTEPFEKGLEILENKVRCVLDQNWSIEHIVLCTNSHWTTTAVLLKMCLDAKMEYLMFHYFSGAIDLPQFIKLPYQNLTSCYQRLALPMDEISIYLGMYNFKYNFTKTKIINSKKGGRPFKIIHNKIGGIPIFMIKVFDFM